jgi:hypothetical protein
MNGDAPAIFRPAAVRRYLESCDRAVLPRFVSPRTFVVLWLLLALLATATVTAWLARVPVYATGPVLAVAPVGDGQEAALVALLPAELLPHLQPGRPLFVNLTGAGSRDRRVILAVEPMVQSPSAVRRRFALDPEASRAVTGPVAVVTVDAGPLPSGLSLAAYAGTVYRGEVEIGSRRVLALVPLIGMLAGG